MLTCPKCKSSVDMGKVFCPVCGTKIDTRHLDRGEVARRVKRRLPSLPWGKLAMVLGVLLALCVALALWPRTEALGASGQKPWARRVPDRLAVAESIGTGQSLEISISERDLNAYLTHVQVPGMALDSCTVALRPDIVHVRMVRRLGSFSIWGFRLEPKLSWDVEYLVHGSALYVKRASMGHLALAGPWRRPLTTRIAATARAHPKWTAWTQHIQALEGSEGELTLSVAR